MDEEVEHGSIPSTNGVLGVEHGEVCTTSSLSPIYVICHRPSYRHHRLLDGPDGDGPGSTEYLIPTS